MNIVVTFRHLPSSDALKNHAEEKLDKLSRYLADPIDVHVVLSVEKIRQIAEVTVHSKAYRAHALEESSDMYSAIDRVAAKIESQIKKHKERVKEHHSNPEILQESVLPAMD